jgi:hypothetical protein
MIGFHKVGFRVLYSKEKHPIPFLESIEDRCRRKIQRPSDDIHIALSLSDLFYAGSQ